MKASDFKLVQTWDNIVEQVKQTYAFELEHRPEDIAVDFIASMTDDYFIDLYAFLFPNDPLNEEVHYKNYF